MSVPYPFIDGDIVKLGLDNGKTLQVIDLGNPNWVKFTWNWPPVPDCAKGVKHGS